jgi:hypothetical protein
LIALSSCLNTRELALVTKGQDAIPIVLADDAWETTRQAAEDLAAYIEKISGIRPEVLTTASNAPEEAIWVGVQPGITEIWPGLSLEFQYPEEILIACNGKNLVIAGRDRFKDGKQTEFGTANAVYTFLQDQLDVRWLWPGPLGEDIIRRETIKIAPFEYRYHPQMRQRDVYRASNDPTERDWTKFQRNYFDSFWMHGGHSFTDWWEKYHKEHPDYFALQPDGSRSGYPNPRTVKLCQSNPAVWEQWLENAEKELLEDPTRMTVSAMPNDGHSSGICVCENCRAWDNLDGPSWTYGYEAGHREEYVAMTDRYVTFWNILARKLKERFPDREVYVSAFAYGPGTPVPEKKLEDNIVIGYVGKFPLMPETGPPDRTPKQGRQEQKEEFRQWSEKAPGLMFRPNLWYWGGGIWGIPEVAMKKTMEDMRFIADNHCMGMFIDGVRGNWATLGPMYYLFAQMAWDPYRDGDEVMKDYYRRGFGKAAASIEEYWDLLEEANGRLVLHLDFTPFPIASTGLVEVIEDIYTRDLLERARELLQQAAVEVTGEPAKYHERIAFLGTGLEFTGLMLQAINTMSLVRESGGKDRVAVEKAVGLWEEIDRLCRNNPDAISLSLNPESRFRVQVIDFLGPPSEEFKRAAGLIN